ncbi:MAG: hypothetical protein RLY93_07740 [Sumerlaeia bacterium]
MTTKDLEFLRFRDFAGVSDYGDSEWLTVAISEKGENGDFFGTSVLVPMGAAPFTEYLERDDWPADPCFGKYCIWYDNFGKIWRYDTPAARFGIEAEPFTFLREYHGGHPNHFEISTEFVLAWNLYPNADLSELRHTDDGGEEIVVVRFQGLSGQGKPTKRVLVSTYHLRLWLMLKSVALLRQFDHRRFLPTKVVIPENEFDSEILSPKNGIGRYEVHVTPDATRMVTSFGACSILRGCDVTLPFDSGKVAAPEQKWATVSLGRDDDGNLIELECFGDEDFRLRGTGERVRYLTPINFKRAVLKKYYDEPSKYDVEPGILRCLGLWSVYIEINHETDLVNVYAGDFFKMPYKEQLHWQAHQVATKQGISAARFARDFEAKFVDLPENLDPIHRFKILIGEVNALFIPMLGEPLFRSLPPGDAHHLNALHLPSVNEQKHFDEFVQSLAKIACDSINVSALKKKMTSLPEENKGSISMLEHAAANGLAVADCLKDLLNALKLCQAIRSRSAAHLKGSDLDKFLKKENMAISDMKERGLILIRRLNEGLRNAISCIQSKQSLKEPVTTEDSELPPSIEM